MRAMSITPALVLTAALLLGAGCSEDDPGPTTTGEVSSDATTDEGGGDSGPNDSGQTDAGTPDGSTVPDAEPDAGTQFPPCSKPSDCDSGFCVESPDGLVCTTGCDPSCPTDWECRQVQNDAGDPAFICINPTARLCHPCTADADCVATGVSAQSSCIDSGNGSFCGAACGVDGGITCPSGYLCDTSLTVPQCVPESGQCACNGLAKSLQLETTCSTTNSVGTCVGKRVCLFNGLTECDALEASEEICNGVDDDCDGAIDDDWVPQPCTVDNEFGSCPGEEFCTFGESQCLGPAAKAEECNDVDDDCDGLTDEDFGDVDNDGIVDCLDPDADGDGTLNDLDCAPLDAAVYPGATETCDGKDTNCDGLTDNEGAVGCTDYYLDIDEDTYGNQNASTRCLCGPDAATFYTASNNTDCDDQKPLVYPDAPELCNNVDDDCDGDTDEAQGLAPCNVTNEFGSCVGDTQCTGGVVICNGPTPQEESCNGVDDNCDGVADEGFPNLDGDEFADCVDDDIDGDGDLNVDDCAPTDPLINSGATEVCGNAIDENCNNQLDDEDAQGCQIFYQDADLDTFGSDTAPSKCLCAASASIYYTVQVQGDCNDLNSFAKPGAAETCNGQDDNCDGNTDEGVQSPCGTCENLCVLEIGEGQEFEWDTAANDSTNVLVQGGDLVLDTSGGLSGLYREVFTGWPVADSPNKTNWGLFILDGTFPDGTTVLVKARVADTEAQIAPVPYTVYGSFPPEEFPIELGLNGHVMEIELSLTAPDTSTVPSINEVTIIAEKAP